MSADPSPDFQPPSKKLYRYHFGLKIDANGDTDGTIQSSRRTALRSFKDKASAAQITATYVRGSDGAPIVVRRSYYEFYQWIMPEILIECNEEHQGLSYDAMVPDDTYEREELADIDAELAKMKQLEERRDNLQKKQDEDAVKRKAAQNRMLRLGNSIAAHKEHLPNTTLDLTLEPPTDNSELKRKSSSVSNSPTKRRKSAAGVSGKQPLLDDTAVLALDAEMVLVDAQPTHDDASAPVGREHDIAQLARNKNSNSDDGDLGITNEEKLFEAKFKKFDATFKDAFYKTITVGASESTAAAWDRVNNNATLNAITEQFIVPAITFGFKFAPSTKFVQQIRDLRHRIVKVAPKFQFRTSYCPKSFGKCDACNQMKTLSIEVTYVYSPGCVYRVGKDCYARYLSIRMWFDLMADMENTIFEEAMNITKAEAYYADIKSIIEYIMKIDKEIKNNYTANVFGGPITVDRPQLYHGRVEHLSDMKDNSSDNSSESSEDSSDSMVDSDDSSEDSS